LRNPEAVLVIHQDQSNIPRMSFFDHTTMTWLDLRLYSRFSWIAETVVSQTYQSDYYIDL